MKVFKAVSEQQDPLRLAITKNWLMDESALVEQLVKKAELPPQSRKRIQQFASNLVKQVRKQGQRSGALEAFLQEYDLSTNEGIALMCLAEALLRIPDPETADKLIHDKLSSSDWDKHLGHSESMFVNASTWGLMLTGKFIHFDETSGEHPASFLKKFISRSSEQAVRIALKQAMGIMAHQFVMGRDIDEALLRSHAQTNTAYRYSYDMLGEAALCQPDANKYFEAYQNSIDAIVADNVTDNKNNNSQSKSNLQNAASISIKLSALHPRYDYFQHERVLKDLVPKVLQLALRAKNGGIGLTIDAEESDTLDLSLDIFSEVYKSDVLEGWHGFGLAVQAYQKRALPVLEWLASLSEQQGRQIPVRLVKGAYWDTEIKHAQELGFTEYPVFTRKASTDVSYLACVKYLLDKSDLFYPQFATHNAHTVASIMEMAMAGSEFEFQRLHGMGESLYEPLVGDEINLPCRVYAPVGSHEDLLPYLVRRLLENGANTSFVNRIEDSGTPVKTVIADPVKYVMQLDSKPHSKIPLPYDLYGEERKNSIGINFNDSILMQELADEITSASDDTWEATPLINGHLHNGARRQVVSPANNQIVVGRVQESSVECVDSAFEIAHEAAYEWNETPADDRASLLEMAADLIELKIAELIYLCVMEGGKTLVDAVAEIREAADFCRYYAMLSREKFGTPMVMRGPTGEKNEFSLHGRGVFVCISPWNFPVAIFTGQIAAALAAGNTVIAKPARQTSLVAMQVIKLFHEAGIPESVLHFVPGVSGVFGKRLLNERMAGVVFTGATETAWHLNRTLAQRDGPIVPLIAETGGQNIMIADSSALPEQVVNDVIRSAFNSAGQRCSALRVLFIQSDCAKEVIALLRGAMAELVMGDPALLSTDVGPIIDHVAKDSLEAHIKSMSSIGRIAYQLPYDKDLNQGSFVAPCMFEIDSMDQLEKEVFGPVLHVIRYKADKLDSVIKSVNESRYGLTLGIHSRIDSTINYIRKHARVGNVYVNRNMVGAVVGVQPFGGEGLSGTGPKAGGPNYLYRFAIERTVSTNTAAIGGNTSLATMGEDGEIAEDIDE